MLKYDVICIILMPFLESATSETSRNVKFSRFIRLNFPSVKTEPPRSGHEF